MLLERTFLVGGSVCLAGAVLLAIGIVWSGLVAIDPFAALTPAMLAGFGVFLLYVARGARAERLRLLALAEAPRPPRA